jgi:hypothetical protein
VYFPISVCVIGVTILHAATHTIYSWARTQITSPTDMLKEELLPGTAREVIRSPGGFHEEKGAGGILNQKLPPGAPGMERRS